VRSTMLTLLLFGTTLVGYEPSTGKGWRGLVPLHSTRSDVERLLGPGKDACNCAYDLDDANVLILYSEGDCNNGTTGGWLVPSGTVLRITVHVKPRPRVSELGIDISKFEKRQAGHLKDVFEYYNAEDGITLEVREGTVLGFYYGPAQEDKEDKRLRCP